MAEDYKPNSESHSVVKHKVSVKKKNILSELIDDFVNETVKPRIKDTASDLFDGLLGGIGSSFKSVLFGDDDRNYRRDDVSYHSLYRYNYRNEKRRDYNRVVRGETAKSSRGYRFCSIQYDDYYDAKEVLTEMRDWLETYHFVSVLNYYDFSNCEDLIENVDDKYGWTDLDGVKIEPVYERGKQRWIIDLPKAYPEPR